MGSFVAPELAQHVTKLHNRAILRHEVMGESIDPHPMSLLTREREVAKCVADGMADVEMGEKLRMSPRTVNKHVQKIYQKRDLKSRSS